MEMKNRKEGFPLSDEVLRNLLRQYPAYFDTLLQHNDRWRIQVIYTQIDRTADNQPILTHHYYNVDPKLYFYPASTV